MKLMRQKQLNISNNIHLLFAKNYKPTNQSRQWVDGPWVSASNWSSFWRVTWVMGRGMV